MKITKQIVSLFVLTAFVLSMFALVGAQEKAAVSFKTVGGHTILPVEDLRPGMKGVARTVFSGSASEEFGVEIIGVLPSFNGPVATSSRHRNQPARARWITSRNSPASRMRYFPRRAVPEEPASDDRESRALVPAG